ncbi:PAS domain S-box protein [Fodinibius sp. AD559]|uniref:PAS domain S-box protein n=1 Tax=Fodinibius sp. AD559 TaxID=3424179 RepID=UPI004046EC82
MEIRNVEQFFHGSPLPMLVYDQEDYAIKEVNQAMVEAYGYSREEMLFFTLFDLRPEEGVPKLKKYLSQIDNETVGDEGVWKHQKKNGEFVYAIYNSAYLAELLPFQKWNSFALMQLFGCRTNAKLHDHIFQVKLFD